MSTAILTGQPVPGSSIEGDLRSLGFDVRVAADAADAERLVAEAPCDQRVALVDARFVGHVHALRLGLTDPRFSLAALPGAVTAQPDGRVTLTRVLARENSEGGGTAVAVDSLPDRIVTALAEDGAEVYRPELGSLVAAVPADPQARNEARQAVADVDDEAVRLKSAVKSRDGFFTTYFISPYSRYIARWCARRGLTPNQVTTASLLTALIAAACAATGTRGGFIAAGVLLIASFVLDCTDGQLARYSLQYSTLGAWLDATFDRAKEYAYYAGLALGAARGGDDVWALALGAMILQTCRHVVDFSFNEANHDATANTSPTAALSDKLDSVGWTVWVRRMIVLPIGERWAMIAVLTAVTTPRITFYVLLVGCAFAATYTTAGRVLRVADPQGQADGPGGSGAGGPRGQRTVGRTDRALPAGPGPQDRAAQRRRRRGRRGVGGLGMGSRLAGRPARRALRPAVGRSRVAPPQGRPRLVDPPVLQGSRVLHRPDPGSQGGRERSPASGFRAGGRRRLPSLRHGVPHPRQRRSAPGLAGARRRGARRTDSARHRPGRAAHRLAVHGRAHGPGRGRGPAGARREHPLLGVRWGSRRTRRRRTRM
ncbi:LOW QUALITY PROTEIN: integral membrane transferase, partial [Streptomyces sviceus ATCC 29083]